MGKNKQKEKKKATTTQTPLVRPKKVFIYNTLNTHEKQREIWEEVKEGKAFALDNYELRMFDTNEFYIVKKFGSQVAGKLYELTDEQMKATDWFMGEEFENFNATQEGTFFSSYRLIKGE